jgi:hypothetical protein
MAADHADEVDFILVTNRSNQPYIMSCCLPVPPQDLRQTPTVIVNTRRLFMRFCDGEYYFAHTIWTAAQVSTFDEMFQACRPPLEACCGDGAIQGGQVMATIPCSDRRRR